MCVLSSIENLASALQTVYKDSSLTPVHCFPYRNDYKSIIAIHIFNLSAMIPLRPNKLDHLEIPHQTINPRHKEQDTRASLNPWRVQTISHQISYDGILKFSQVQSQRTPFLEVRGADHADPAFGSRNTCFALRGAQTGIGGRASRVSTEVLVWRHFFGGFVRIYSGP